MKKAKFAFLSVFVFILVPALAQQSQLSDAVQKFNTQARKTQAWNITLPEYEGNAGQNPGSGIKQQLQKFRNSSIKNQFISKAHDSDSLLIIGAVPGDSLIITGKWLCEVDILVFGDGKLRFKNAEATILGNISVWGEHAELTADSSEFYIPQTYFYERSIVAAGAGKVRFNHVKLDFSGLSHNMVAADSSTFDFTDVTKVGFTTNGVYGKSKYYIDGTNLAGEFVIGDQCQLDFRNSNTVLLWHEVPQNGVFHFSFPSSDTVAAYHFNSDLPGIINIDYTIDLNNCTDVMWALMPADGSDVDIADSEIRAIGLWFLAPDTVTVNGLVNKTDYADFTAPLADRSLRLRNSSVQTWSLYPMRKSKLKVSGCILGEIGAMGTSQVATNGVFIDGTGGYMWASDTTFFMAFATPLTTYARTERNGIMIYAYSSLNFGIASALGNSTLLVIQSTLPEEPVAFGNASVWNVNIKQPSSGNSNSVIPITGYALIDRTPTCVSADMAWYQVFYSKQDNDSLFEITPRISVEKRNETLAEWNTSGLKPGQYLIHLFVSDASESPVIVEAVLPFSLNPGVFGISELSTVPLHCFPNPANDIISIQAPWKDSRATLLNSCGQIAWEGYIESDHAEIDLSNLAPGLYLINLEHEGEMAVSRIIKQ